MAITAETRTDIIELVVGMFGAAPGASVLSELADAVDAGLSLKDLSITLGASAVFKTEYPSFLTNTEFATNYLTDFLGGNPGEVSSANFTLAVDAVVALLNSGKSRGEVVYDVVTAVSAVAETDTNFGTAAARLNNQTEVAEYYSVTSQQSGDTLAELKEVIEDVTSSDTTVTTAKADVDGTANVGTTFTLTGNADTLSPSSATATTKTTALNDTFRAPADGNLTTSDFVDGGAGTDVLNATITNASQTIAPSLTSIEKIFLTPTTAAAATLTFSGASVTGANEIWVKDAADADDTDDADEGITVNNITTAVTVGIEGGDAAAGDGYIDYTFAFSGATGTSDSATLALNKAAADVVTIANIETLTISESGTSASNLDSLVLANTSSLVVGATGKGVSIDAMTAANLKTINASSSTAGVTVPVDAANATTTFTGGSGNDEVIFGTTNTFTKADTVTGGEGTDTLTVDVDEATATVAFTNITGFETLKVLQATTAADVIDLGLWGGITNITFDAAASATTTVNSMVSGATVSLATTSGVDLNLETEGASDSLTLDLNGAGVTYTVDATNFETIAVNTDGATGTSTLALTDPQLKTITLTQKTTTNQAVDLGTLGTVVSTVDLSNFKATTQTNGVTVVLSNAAVNGATVTGSANDDSITSSSAIDTINAGVGADTIVVVGGKDTYDFGSDDDTDTVTVAAGNLTNANQFTIKNFQVTGTGHDTLTIDDTTNIATAGAGDISDGLAAGEIQTVATAATAYTVAGGEAAIEFAFEFDADVDLDSATTADFLSAVGAANDGTASSKTAGTITAAANADAVLLIAYQDGNAYLFEGDSGTGDTAIGDGTGANDGISLVAVIEGVAVGALSDANFV